MKSLVTSGHGIVASSPLEAVLRNLDHALGRANRRETSPHRPKASAPHVRAQIRNLGVRPIRNERFRFAQSDFIVEECP